MAWKQEGWNWTSKQGGKCDLLRSREENVIYFEVAFVASPPNGSSKLTTNQKIQNQVMRTWKETKWEQT